MIKKVAPPPTLTTSEWADAERKLSPESSAEPGTWKTSRAPYQKGMLDAVNDPHIRRVVVMSSAQVGKTEILLNTVGYFIHHDPAPILLLQPTLEMAETFSKDRLTPMVRDTPALRGKLKDNKSKDSNNTLLHKKFPGGQITLAGANSPASLASRPIRIILCDEVDRYPKSAGSEGDPVNLADKRSTTFFNRKTILVSTPVIKGDSKIESEYQASDQRKYHVPCPFCGEVQVLKWKNLIWDRGPETAKYKCEHCEGLISEKHKASMLAKGKWIAEKEFNGVAGFHINELYSPWSSWANMVRDFLIIKDNPQTLQTWVNTALGETWEQKGDSPDWERLYERRENYPVGCVPNGVLFLTAGADVQNDRIEVEVVGWGRDKQSWSIDYRVFYGNTADDAAWKKLDELLNETFETESKLRLPIRILAVDSGFNTQSVYHWCRRHSISRVIAIKGNEKSNMSVGTASAVDINLKGTKYRNAFKIFPIGVNVLKSELYGWLKLSKPVEGEPYPPGYCHFPEYGSEFFKQLTAEHIVRRVVRGYSRFVWEKIRGRNEALDCRIYARAAATVFGLDRFKDHHWERLESEIGSQSPPQKRRIKIKRRPSTWMEERDW